MPTVSVIIPVYNRAQLIKETLESVFAQTYTDYEVIVIDDGSTDNTEEVVALLLADHPQLRYVKQTNAGVSAARNHGIFEARGEWIAFLDSDDLWFPNKLEKQMTFLAEHPTAGAVCSNPYSYQGGQVVKNENGEPVRSMQVRETSVLPFELFAKSNYVLTSFVVVRKTVLYKAGLFEGAWNIGEDVDMWTRISRYTEFWHLNEVLGYYRIHDTNMSTNLEKTYLHDGLAREIQMIRWGDESHTVKRYEQWVCSYNSGLADWARRKQNYRQATHFFWKALCYAHGWKLKSRFFAKFFLAKFFPFVFRIWDK